MVYGATMASIGAEYDMSVMARLRIPRSKPSSPEEDETLGLEREQFVEALRDWYEQVVEGHYLEAEAAGERPGRPPSVVAQEVASISRQIEQLVTYRDQLLVFGRSLASEVVPARHLAARSGISHSTIVRMASDDAIEELAVVAGPVAALALEYLNFQDDPELHARMRHVLQIAGDGER